MTAEVWGEVAKTIENVSISPFRVSFVKKL